MGKRPHKHMEKYVQLPFNVENIKKELEKSVLDKKLVDVVHSKEGYNGTNER